MLNVEQYTDAFEKEEVRPSISSLAGFLLLLTIFLNNDGIKNELNDYRINILPTVQKWKIRQKCF